jgi:hypothetical protein
MLTLLLVLISAGFFFLAICVVNVWSNDKSGKYPNGVVASVLAALLAISLGTAWIVDYRLNEPVQCVSAEKA